VATELEYRASIKVKNKLLVYFLLSVGILSLMPSIFAKQIEPIHFLQPYWPSKMSGDPTGIVYVGDWDIFQNLYSTLVEMATAKAVKPALAERWTQSADGKRWVFYLRKNLHWSDGAPLTTEQVAASLNRTAKGTIHTNLKSYVESIKALPDYQIEMILKKTPSNFLTLLSFVDCSILHPDAYKGDTFTWDAPNSGAFRVISYKDTEFELIANPYYWNNTSDRIQRVIVTKPPLGDSSLRIATLLNKSWDASQVDAGIIENDEQIKKLKEKYDVFMSNPDFNFCIFFSKKRTKNGTLNPQIRSYLLKSIYNSFWAENKTNPLRAVGLRIPKSKGAITVQEFDKIFSNLKDYTPKNLKKLPRRLEILLTKRAFNKSNTQKFYKILESLNFEVKSILKGGPELEKMQIDGDFDLYVSFSGVSEDDPDTAWRYYNKDFAEPVATVEELDKAQLETDAAKRNQIYQEFEKRAIERALFIPLKYEPTYIVTSKRVVLDTTLAADWGLQLFKLRMR